MSKEVLKSILSTILESFDELNNDQTNKLINTLTPILSDLPNQYKNSIILRAKDYFPIKGYVTADDCLAEWISDNIIKFTVSGARYTIIQYRYNYGVYIKEEYWYGSNVGIGHKTEHKKYNDSRWMTEDEVLDEISKITDD